MIVIPAMRLLRVVSGGVAMLLAAMAAAAQSRAVNVDTLGPRVGQAAPDFSGVDQFGRTQTLASLAGAKGLMLVFYRSADW
jgi:hypothetical protein